MIAIPFPDKKYSIIYADPPWQYSDTHTNGAAEDHYQTMTVKEICALPVQDIAANNSALFLWATYPLIREAMEVIEGWGFEYKTVAFVWVKKYPNGNYCISLGNYTRSNTEPCLLAIWGKIRAMDKTLSQLIVTTRESHSKKPKIVRENIVRLFGDLPRIELFSRDKIEGWDCWGTQIPDSEQRLLKLGGVLD
jgi:site-specific DNA-methyltransferase (adenine-specific)